MPAYYEIKIRDHLDQCWRDLNLALISVARSGSSIQYS
jgi:hypothetical protein